VSGVAWYDVDVSLNSAPWAPWYSGTRERTATYVGNPGNRYRFRIRAADTLGNMSAYLVSDEVAIAAQEQPTPVTPTPEPPRPADPQPKLTSSRLRGTTLTLRGTVGTSAGSGQVKLTWQATVRRKRFTIRRKATVRNGSFAAKLRIPAKAHAARKAILTLAYAGRTSRLTLKFRMPRGKNTIGRSVDVLSDLMAANPEPRGMVNQVRWLP
jgi:hypothetical protein